MEQIGEALPPGMQVAQLACLASGRQPPFSFMLPGCRIMGRILRACGFGYRLRMEMLQA